MCIRHRAEVDQRRHLTRTLRWSIETNSIADGVDRRGLGPVRVQINSPEKLGPGFDADALFRHLRHFNKDVPALRRRVMAAAPTRLEALDEDEDEIITNLELLGTRS